MAGFQTDLAVGFARLLDALGHGTWDEAGMYEPDQTGIVLRTLPQRPDRIIALSTYTVTDDPSLSDSVTGLQIVTRWAGGDPRPNDDLADAIFEDLHGMPRTTLLTGLVVVSCFRRSGTSIGQDSNQRWRTLQNLYVDAHYPTVHRS